MHRVKEHKGAAGGRRPRVGALAVQDTRSVGGRTVAHPPPPHTHTVWTFSIGWGLLASFSALATEQVRKYEAFSHKCSCFFP